ncbi:MAG: tetratricopeptide repeat protein [Patescibacteria group bacterium]
MKKVKKVLKKIEPQKAPLNNFKDIINFYRLNWTILLLIVVIATIAYANSLGGQFVSADDISSIVQNQRLRDFPNVVKSLNFTSSYASALINVFGVVPLPFHLTALLVHILNAFLVLLLTYILFGRRPALYASLIFSVLPTGSEALFWISGMVYMFITFFSLLCINLYFIYRSTKNWRFLALSVFIYLIALILMQTPWMLTVPFIIFSLDLFTVSPILNLLNLRKAGNFILLLKDRWSYAIYLLCLAVFWLVWIGGQYSKRVTGLVLDYYSSSDSTPLIKRLPYTIYKTVELYIFPNRLSFFHEEDLTTDMYVYMIAVSALLMFLIVYLIYKKSKYAGLVLAIAASVAPTFSPVQVAWFVAERYLYLGSALFAMILSLIIIKVDYRYTIKNLANYILVTLLLLYSVRLFIRAGDFKSSKTLWTATQKTAPISYRVYNNLGDVYSNEQNWEMAIASFKTAIQIAPNYYDAIHNLGYTYMLMGDYENAKKYLLESYQINNNLYQAVEKLGQIELKQGNKEKAKEYFNKALEINPNLTGLPKL